MYRNGRNGRGGIFKRDDNFRTILILSGIVMAIAIITFVVTYSIYNNKISDDAEKIVDSSTIASLNSNSVTKSASSSIGKSVNQAKNELNFANNIVQNVINNDVVKNVVEITEKNIDVSNSVNGEPIVEETVAPKSVVKEEKEDIKDKPKKDPAFSKPVEGEIIREFAKDNLVYSETLDEWITHLGIDIKADKTTVVVAAADGVVESIKNDPRYGLTVVITHDNGFKTVYSNLLTAEFVTEGEQVSVGQTLGTVGNNAAFEISDGPHLHFELIKDNEKVDPKIFIRF